MLRPALNFSKEIFRFNLIISSVVGFLGLFAGGSLIGSVTGFLSLHGCSICLWYSHFSSLFRFSMPYSVLEINEPSELRENGYFPESFA
jgi:hypothetical protein